MLCLTDTEIMLLHTRVDLVVTLGGDGTVLWVCVDDFFFFILILIFLFFESFRLTLLLEHSSALGRGI